MYTWQIKIFKATIVIMLYSQTSILQPSISWIAWICWSNLKVPTNFLLCLSPHQISGGLTEHTRRWCIWCRSIWKWPPTFMAWTTASGLEGVSARVLGVLGAEECWSPPFFPTGVPLCSDVKRLCYKFRKLDHQMFTLK